MVKTAYSNKRVLAEAIAEIKAEFIELPDIKMIVFFVSWEGYDHNKVSALMQDAFPGAATFGCSSHAELCGAKTLTGTITAMAFSSHIITDAYAQVFENISEGIDVAPVFAAFDVRFNTSLSNVKPHEYGGIVLIDGLSRREEDVMDKIGNITNIMFIGGSASDALKFESTYVYANGKTYINAAVLAVFKPRNGIDFIKTQSVTVTDQVLTVTKANHKERTIYEFDNKPAAARYAEVLGIDQSEIDTHFFANPVGIVIDSDVYIRSCQKSEGDALVFYCNVLEGTKLRLLKIKDMITDTKTAVENKRKELGDIAGIIDFRCVLRTLQLENSKEIDDYGAIFKDIPTIGFSTYGEEFIGHINQTSTMLVFK